jgi:hypothetical protein
VTAEEWRSEWPPQHEVDEWAAQVAAEALDDPMTLAQICANSPLTPEKIDAWVDAQPFDEIAGDHPFMAPVLRRAFRRGLEQFAQFEEIRSLPETGA